MKPADNKTYNRAFGNRYFIIALSAILVFIFMAMLLARINRDFDQAQQTQFDYRLAELKAAVRLMEADLISRGEMQNADKYEGANPMDWLEGDSSHYLGIILPQEALKDPGNWFYNGNTNEISYVPATLKGQEVKQENIAKILRFKVRALRSKEMESKYTGLLLSQVRSID